MGRLDTLYGGLPVWAQHGAVSAYGAYWHWLRFGPGFARAARGYRERDRLGADAWRTWQATRLREVLSAASRSVPYYRSTWNATQKAAAADGRLEELPLLGKDAVRADFRAFLRDDMLPRRTLVFHTSGTTGTPVATVWTVPELRDSLAQREVRSAGWAGVSFTMPRATFSGRMVEPNPASTGPYYRFNLAERQVYLSPFHLRPDTAALYVDALRRHGVQWLTGYAVTYYLLAELILEQGLVVPPLRAVITTSEKVTAEMRRVMQRAYGCRVYEEYSTVENALFVSECPHGRLHSSPDVAHVEILRPDGTPCDPGEAGEVVTTNLSRVYQSMIRFRLGDVAAWDPEPCPCGRAMPVMREVLGRIEDVVVRPDGRRLVRFHGIFVDQPHVREGQIVQETLSRIRVNIVPVDGFGERDRADIARRIRQRLGDDVEVIVAPVADIPRTRAGKFKAVVSLLNDAERPASWQTGG
jgi:phenylacetate-CoA ligase